MTNANRLSEKQQLFLSQAMTTNKGAFSFVIVDTVNNRITKTYVEHSGETDSPYLKLIGNNVYVINWFSENDSHKRLVSSLPNMFPHIYAYSKRRYVEVDENERPPIPEPLLHRKPESLSLCKVEMDYLNYPSLNDVIDEIDDISVLRHILKQWFELQLIIIKEVHILPWDVQVGNMLYDSETQTVHLIDYGFYEFFELVDRIDTSATLSHDTIYWFDPTEDKHKIYKDYDSIEVQKQFTLSDDEVRDLFMFRISWFSKHRSECKLHNVLASKLGLDVCVQLHETVMRELRFSQKHIELIRLAITNGELLFRIQQSVVNWLGGPYGNICSTHKLLTYMKIFPDKFNECYDELKMTASELRKMNRDEFWNYYLNTLRTTRSSLFCQMAYTMYLNYDPKFEYERLIMFVKKYKQTVDTLYRCETTDRFNGSDKELVVGKTIRWENLIPATQNKQYALTYLSNGRGTSILSQNSPKHYLFVFKNIKAVHLHDMRCNHTTYSRRYNASNVEDMNRLNSLFTCCLVVSNEWIVNPFTSYVVTKTYTIEAPEMNPPTMITRKPIKETYTGNMLTVNVIELIEKTEI